MLALLGVLTIVTATVVACAAEKMPHQARAETLAGLMLIGGLSTIGAQLAWIV